MNSYESATLRNDSRQSISKHALLIYRLNNRIIKLSFLPFPVPDQIPVLLNALDLIKINFCSPYGETQSWKR